jgi:hypothetical protein
MNIFIDHRPDAFLLPRQELWITVTFVRCCELNASWNYVITLFSKHNERKKVSHKFWQHCCRECGNWMMAWNILRYFLICAFIPYCFPSSTHFNMIVERNLSSTICVMDINNIFFNYNCARSSSQSLLKSDDEREKHSARISKVSFKLSKFSSYNARRGTHLTNL